MASDERKFTEVFFSSDAMYRVLSSHHHSESGKTYLAAIEKYH